MELPELKILGNQMMKKIKGKVISKAEIANPKCLNLPLEEFRSGVIGRRIEGVESKGKWLFMKLNPDQFLLFNPGMGADIIYYDPGDNLPPKYQIRIVFDDGSGFTIRVWWFCYLHLMPEQKLSEHKLTGKLGPSPLEKSFTLDRFKALLAEKRGQIKPFLLSQRNISGIGNVYIQDMLFNANLHPKRTIQSLTESEIKTLYKSIQSVLQESIQWGGLEYEKDFYGNKGGYGANQFKVAYKTGKPCPACQTEIQKIKTGSTSSYICPTCQPLLNSNTSPNA